MAIRMVEHDPKDKELASFLYDMLHGETRRMCRVFRYNSSPVIRQENVAEHSWYVAQMCMRMYYYVLKNEPEAKLDLGKLLSQALSHDMDEMLTGDIPRPFKYHNERIRKEIDIAAKDIFTSYATRVELPPECINAVLDCKDGLEGELVALADLLTVISYVAEESAMGNSLINDKFIEMQQYWVKFTSKMTIKCLQPLAAMAAAHALNLGRR